jgi:acyl-CoA reductase-like NAD-dependent aldehyde dehydrogenase
MGKQASVGFVGGERCSADAERVEHAIAGVVTAADTVRRTSSFDRAAVLDRIATALADRPDALAQALADESGYLSKKDMQLEVQRAIEVFTLTAAYARTGMSEMLNLDAVERARGAIGYIKRVPIGPVLGITAYNGPLLIAAHKIAPAIAAGAPIVIKPSPRVARAAINLAEIVVASGWPADAIAVLDLDNEATMALVRDPRLPVISFTGGAVGWKIKEAAPMKHVHLELGGVGAAFVAADANLAVAAKECAAGGFVRSGQSCISVQRIYVERSRYLEFVEAFLTCVKELQPGGPSAISPMVDEAAAQRVETVIADAVRKGAAVVCGGERDGAYLPPTVLKDATGDMLVMRQETFGPVVAVSAVDSVDMAIAEMNAVPGAIHHGLYTANLDIALRMSDEIKAGGVIVNGPGTWRVDHMPYGGTGTSGFGREGVRFAVEEYTEPKVIVIRPSAPLQ